MSKHIKGVLPMGWYYVKCVNATIKDEEMLRLTFKIDVGEHKWRTLIDEFYLDEGGMVSFWDMCNGINYEPYEDTEDPFFALQFLGQRAKVHVQRKIDGEFKVNRIIEYTLPDVPAESDVLKEKEDDYFFEGNHKRKLPINK